MSSDHLYTVFFCYDGKRGERYHVTKQSRAIIEREEEFYLVQYYPHTDYYRCNCPSFRRTYCRHRDIVREFKKANRVGSGQLYDYDGVGWTNYFIHVDNPGVI